MECYRSSSQADESGNRPSATLTLLVPRCTDDEARRVAGRRKRRCRNSVFAPSTVLSFANIVSVAILSFAKSTSGAKTHVSTSIANGSQEPGLFGEGQSERYRGG